MNDLHATTAVVAHFLKWLRFPYSIRFTSPCDQYRCSIVSTKNRCSALNSQFAGPRPETFSQFQAFSSVSVNRMGTAPGPESGAPQAQPWRRTWRPLCMEYAKPSTLAYVCGEIGHPWHALCGYASNLAHSRCQCGFLSRM